MRILESYRWRRRIVISAVVALLAPLIYLGVHYSNPGSPDTATGPSIDFSPEPKHAPFTPEKQRAVRPVLKEFISTAVAGHDVPRSWDLVAPSFKAGFTRKQWHLGDIPVVPYPAADRGLGTWSFVNYSYTNTVSLEVFLFPQPGSGYSAMTADVELVRNHGGQWLVDYWMPKRFHGPAAVASSKARTTAKPKHPAARPKHRVAAPKQFTPPKGRLGGYWWAVPLSILSLIVLLPIVIGGGVWYRNRKAYRDHLRSVSERR
ncbi:MAG: hypothetical protein ABI896_04790 [Actinomycetota bacterium]